MDTELLLDLMKRRAGWPLGELADTCEVSEPELLKTLQSLQASGLVICSPRGNWRAVGAVKSTKNVTEWGHRSRLLIYSPQILAACPQFTRNTVLHFVSDELVHFRLRDYHDGLRTTVKNVGGITLTSDLQHAYQWMEIEFDDEESQMPFTENAFWEQRIAEHNAAHHDLLERNAHIVFGSKRPSE